MPKIQQRPQDPPNAIQLEPVEGCSLACDFCGVQGIRESVGNYKFMNDETVQHFISTLNEAMEGNNWNPRLELAMHGEPTMHPNIVAICDDITNGVNPRELIMVSNGTRFASHPALADELAAAGVTSICLDQYDGCDFVPKFVKDYKGGVPVYNFNDKKFRSLKHSGCYIVIKDDVTELESPYDKVNTHCGGGGKPWKNNPAIEKRCAKPFRELSIRWDGSVALCCNDFRGIYKIDSILHHDNLDTLWQHKNFDAARRVLYHNSREFDPCRWCDALSPRVGLLPDKFGKLQMPAPTPDTCHTLEVAVKGAPLTVPVLRGWESEAACLPEHVKLVQLKTQPIDEQGTQ